MTAVAIVPAAGSGKRFGSPLKLLAMIDGVPMVERTLRALLAGGLDAIIVVTAPGPPLAGISALGDPRVRAVINPDPARGMFSSIQTGAGAVAVRAGCVIVHPADMPFISPQTVSEIRRHCLETGRIVAAAFNGKRGHPVAIPASVVRQIVSAPPDANLSALLDAAPEGRVSLAVDDPGVVRDVDRPGDLL